MRSGGRLFLLLGVVIAAAAALFLFFLLPGQQAAPVEVPTTPTAVPRVRVVVVRADVPANTLIADTETYLTTDEIPEPEFNAEPGAYFTNPADLINKVTLRPLIANERIRKSDITDGGLSLLIPTAAPDQPRRKAIPFQVNTLTGVADLITPGDYVDLVVSFKLTQVYLRPGLAFDSETKTYNVTFTEDDLLDGSTKTLIQNIQVLKILRPRAAEEGTPTPAPESAAPPTNPDGSVAGSGPAAAGGVPTGDTFVVGNWIIVLAVTDQEAEIIRYSLQEASGMALVLRGRGDTAVEDTVGVTLSILVSQFGLPAPEPLGVPAPDTESLTPVPGR